MLTTTQIIDDGGLICGYVLHKDGTQQRLDWHDVDREIANPDSRIWLHFNLADMRAKRWLEGCTVVPRLAKHIILGTANQMMLEPVERGLVGVLGDLHHEFDIDPSKIGVLRLYLDDRLLISARRHPLKSIDSLRRSVANGTPTARPIGLVIRLLHHLAETFGSTITELGETIDRIEDRILDDHISNEGGDLGRARQLIVRLRRHLVPQRHALIGLLNHLPDWLNSDEISDLRQAVERLDMLGHDLDLVQDRARLLQDEIANKQAERTNHNLYVLSIVTTIFLPITLITGVFGMNVGGLPGVQSNVGFDGVMLLMILTVLVSLCLLYWKRLF
ncbi:MAG TPA: CorA family divalent cation transporter [Dongiaceae bacterium]|nr:CorA family divalent cation transporter [Dongiaceae bacterium]